MVCLPIAFDRERNNQKIKKNPLCIESDVSVQVMLLWCLYRLVCALLSVGECFFSSYYHRIIFVCFHYFYAIQIIEAHNCLSNSCILCSQNLWAFINRFDWNRLPAAEFERHYLQNDRENQNTECKCIDCGHATDYAYKSLTKCLVQTTVAPPSWSVDVINGSFFWLWQGFIASCHASIFWCCSYIS